MEGSSKKNSFMRYLNLVIGCFCIGMAYQINGFNVYANAVKQTFDYTQSQLETIISMGFLGLVTSWPGGVLFEHIGPRKTSVLGFLSSLAFLLMWSATKNPEFYHDNIVLFALYELLASCGGGIMYVVAMSVNLRNFRTSRHGTINGVLQACSSTGPGILIVVYNLAFVNGHVIDAENQNLGGFFLLMSVLYAVFTICAMIFYGDYPEDEALIEIENANEKSDISDGSMSSYLEHIDKTKVEDAESEISPINGIKSKLEEKPEDMSGLDLLKQPYFHYILWPFVIVTSLEGVFITNVTSFLVSFDLTQYSLIVPVINPFFGTVCKPLTGIISDVFQDKIPRSGYLFFWGIVTGVFYIFAIFFFYNFPFMITIMLVVDLAAYAGFTLSPLILMNVYGMKSFPRNFGIMMFFYACTVLILALLLGVFYEQKVVEGVGLEGYCYGIPCYGAYFIIAAIVSFFAAGFSWPLVLAAKRRIFGISSGL